MLFMRDGIKCEAACPSLRSDPRQDCVMADTSFSHCVLPVFSAMQLEGEISDQSRGRFDPGLSVPQVRAGLESQGVRAWFEGCGC